LQTKIHVAKKMAKKMVLAHQIWLFLAKILLVMYIFLWFLTFGFTKTLRFFGYFKKNIEFCILLKKANVN